MSKYYGSKSEIDAWFIKRKPTAYDIEDEVVIANLERTMSLMKQRMEKLKVSRGIFGSNGLDADANDFFSFRPPLYPERPGQIECDSTVICPSYLKSGTCKYGITCKFDHPPPGEAIAMATVQGTSSSVGGEGDEGTETIQEPEQ